MRPFAPGPIYGTSPAAPPRRRALAVVVASGLVLGSAASLAGGLVSRNTPAAPPNQSRPLSALEAGRLATMRLHNFQDGRVGLRGTLGYPGAQVRLAGWVDWQRPLAYLSVTGPTPGPADGLVQAMPGVIALRPGRTSPEPPAEPPEDGWRVRALPHAEPSPIPLDTTLAVLFAMAVNQVDAADLLAGGEARWVDTDTVNGLPVDVLLAPGALADHASPGPATPAPGALPLPGGVRYWLDADARLHRLEVVVGTNVPLRLDFDRADRREVTAVDALGGGAVSPRPVTAAEAESLARLRQRNRASGGGTFTISLPGERANLVTATGWLDWGNPSAYLAVQDTDTPAVQTLVRADRFGVAVLSNVERRPDGRPPLPPPPGAWTRTRWEQRGTNDFDLLLNNALTLSSSARDDPGLLRRTALWLRADRLHGVPVAVYEMPAPAGASRLRYWVDTSGTLRRLEVRTSVGGFGQLDIRVGDRLPVLPTPPTSPGSG